MKTGRYTLFDLLTHPEIEQIVIPELQRDYVWEKRNVSGLLDTILGQCNKLQKVTLNCYVGNIPIEQFTLEYLQEEYNRIRFSTRIGFIYAYHDSTYEGKFFLIDGQQRITTLFLLLLSLYCRCNYSKGNQGRDLSDFKKNYYRKLDFLVREVSHDFLNALVDYEYDNSPNNPDNAFANNAFDYDFIDKDRRYCSQYAKDITAQHLLSNYKYITERLSNVAIDKLKIIDYVENYIEFNYFDTNISDQGEKLYLYMNSRGEFLQHQEIVRSALIGKTRNKLLAGQHWEEMQNFFWLHCGENPNADIGFKEFLKWVVIIHLCTHNWKELDKPLSYEELEEYIKIYHDKTQISDWESLLEKQNNLLKDYVMGNGPVTSLDVDYIYRIFEALKALMDPALDPNGHIKHMRSDCFPDSFLQNIENTNQYPTILGILCYMDTFREEGGYRWPSPIRIRRLAMHIKLHMLSANNSRNPDRATIQVIRLIQAMAEKGIMDIDYLREINDDYLREINDSQLKTYYVSWSESHQLPLIWANNPSAREEWEDKIWETINHKDYTEFCKFLDGDLSCLLTLSSRCSLNSTPSIDLFLHYRNLLKDKVFEKLKVNKDNRALHQALLKYYDYSDYETIPGFMGWGMNRYQLLAEQNKWAKKLNLIGEKGDDERLNFIKALCRYLDGDIIPKLNDYRRLIINYGLKQYMGKYRFLKKENSLSCRPHIMLNSMMVSDEWHLRELLIQMLRDDPYFTYSHIFSYNVLAIEFDIAENNGRRKWKDLQTSDSDTKYYMDVIYEWDNQGFYGKWYLKLGHRTIIVNNVSQKVPLDNMQKSSVDYFTGKTWNLIDGCLKLDQPFYTDPLSNVTEEHIIEKVKEEIIKLKPLIAAGL